MSLSWSQFGLDAATAEERDRFVVLGGGRGLVLGASWNQSKRAGALDDRFSVTRTQVTRTSVVPAVGDIVLWRGYNTADPEDWAMWGAPTRVLDVERHDDRTEVWSLEDADLIDLLDGQSSDHAFVEHDRVLDESELWTALMKWGLTPCCPRCGGEVLPIMYGLPASDPGPKVTTGGCVLLPENPVAQCSRCGHRQSEILGVSAPAWSR